MPLQLSSISEHDGGQRTRPSVQILGHPLNEACISICERPTRERAPTYVDEHMSETWKRWIEDCTYRVVARADAFVLVARQQRDRCACGESARDECGDSEFSRDTRSEQEKEVDTTNAEWSAGYRARETGNVLLTLTLQATMTERSAT